MHNPDGFSARREHAALLGKADPGGFEGLPAPDLRALATRIERATDYEVCELDDGGRSLAVLEADGRRLAAAKPGVR